METEADENFIIKKGVDLAFDGHPPEEIAEIFRTMIAADAHAGEELLARQIAIQGLLSIVRGENPWFMQHKLLAMLGEEYMKNPPERIASEIRKNLD